MLQDRVVLITGAGRGIGAATARLFGTHGARVAVNYRSDESAAAQVVRDIEASGSRALALRADVTDRDQVAVMVAKTEAALGPIDTIVLNANIPFRQAPLLNQSWDDVISKVSQELQAAMYPCQAVLPGMIERGRGVIIAVTSGLSRYHRPAMGAHSAAKAALNAFIRTLAAEHGSQGIRANLVSPGLTETDATDHMPEEMKRGVIHATPLRRLGNAADIAGAILFFATDNARFVTGGYLPVDGGMSMI